MRATFPLPSLAELVPKTKPSYSKPEQLACFSYDSARRLHFDARELKMLKPELNVGLVDSEFANLNANQVNFVHKPDDLQEHLDSLLETLQASVPRTEKAADFVTWRGILTKIICAPFRRHETWDLNIVRRANTIYMEEDKTDRASQGSAKGMYWGHRFEHMLLCPKDEPRSLKERYSEPVNTFREFDVVFKAKLGSHRLIFGAEVDGLDADGKSFIELKTLHARLEQSVLMQDRFMKFWAQSFLAGIDKIVVGRRSDRGYLKELEYLQVSALPRIVRGKVSWCPEAMLNFGTEVLSWLQSVALEEESVHRLCFDGRQISLFPLPEYPVFVPSTFQACLYY